MSHFIELGVIGTEIFESLHVTRREIKLTCHIYLVLLFWLLLPFLSLYLLLPILSRRFDHSGNYLWSWLFFLQSLFYLLLRRYFLCLLFYGSLSLHFLLCMLFLIWLFLWFRVFSGSLFLVFRRRTRWFWGYYAKSSLFNILDELRVLH